MAERMRLSVLVTLIGLVSEISPVFFLGRRKSKPLLKPLGGGWPEEMARKRAKRTGAARSGAARQAAKEIPSGPAVESLVFLMVKMMSSMVISGQRLELSFLL